MDTPRSDVSAWNGRPLGLLPLPTRITDSSHASRWVEHWEIQNLAELVDALLLPSGRLARSPTVSHEGAVIQMGKRSSLSVEQMAYVRRGLCWTRTCELEMTKMLQSQSRTASARGVAGALTPELADVGPGTVNKKMPSLSEKTS